MLFRSDGVQSRLIENHSGLKILTLAWKPVTVWLNGELVVDNVTLENYWDRSQPIFPREQIELQCHGDPIEWRNIFIKEL